MFETIVTFKPFDQWRPGMTWEKLIAEMNANMQNARDGEYFLDADPDADRDADDRIPQRARHQSVRPGTRQIENLGTQIEKSAGRFTRDPQRFRERTTGGYFLDFTVNREAAARYGLTVGDVNEVIETAIGGKTITTTVEGRERYPVNARYARDFRQDLASLKARPRSATSDRVRRCRSSLARGYRLQDGASLDPE